MKHNLEKHGSVAYFSSKIKRNSAKTRDQTTNISSKIGFEVNQESGICQWRFTPICLPYVLR